MCIRDSPARAALRVPRERARYMYMYVVRHGSLDNLDDRWVEGQ